MFIDRRYFRYFDWLSFGITVLLACLSLLFVFSATYRPEQPYSLFFKKQLIGFCTGLIVYFVFASIDYRSLTRFGYFMYFGVLILLAFTIIKGSIGMGAQRWINLGVIKFQPSELVKLFLPAFITYYFYTQKDIPSFTWKDFTTPLIVLCISTFLVLKQPDLGTAIIIFALGMLMFWIAGLSRWFFIGGLILFLVSAPLSWNMLKDYQKKRIAVFLGYGDSKNERYQIEQSKISIGSGGLTGKGFLQGTQNKLAFLPESRTDFIFSVVAEEWGFVGTCILLLLYLILFIHLLLVIRELPFFELLLATGLLTHIGLSTLINVGMVIGLLPIVGIPLPLMSYGISHTWITLASLGWLNGIIVRRFYIGT
ncbi:rod shape-determining protein RodA [Candidatus Babeliales bacterium]|nr:rod shape-determining protein RodA [Candidatus Babeliales bacterium]